MDELGEVVISSFIVTFSFTKIPSLTLVIVIVHIILSSSEATMDVGFLAKFISIALFSPIIFRHMVFVQAIMSITLVIDIFGALSERRMADVRRQNYSLVTPELNLDCLGEIEKHLDGSSSLALAQVNSQLRIDFSNMNLSGGRQPPYLMLSESSHSETSRFFRLDDNGIIPLPLPAARGKRVWGSPHGWIVTMDPTLQLHLLNIFSQVQEPLPPLLPMIDYIRQLHMVTSAFLAQLDWFLIVHKCLVFKIFPTELLVMIILRPENVLYFTKPTKILQWVLVSNPENYVFRDVAFFQGQFYALCDNGSIVKINLHESDLAATATHLVLSNTEHETAKRSYLVASPDHLYGVFLYDFEGGGRTTFVVNKLKFGSLKWEAVESIEDFAFFVGSGNSLYLCPASRVNYRRNCIYFTYDDTEKLELMLSNGARFDFGIYDLDTWLTDWRLVMVEGVRFRHSRPTWIAHGNFRK